MGQNSRLLPETSLFPGHCPETVDFPGFYTETLKGRMTSKDLLITQEE